MDLNTNFLRCLNAKYVGCTKRQMVSDIATAGVSCVVVPQYSIVWTDMEINGAPEDTMVKWYFLNGNTVHYDVMPLSLVVIIEKIEELPDIEQFDIKQLLSMEKEN